MKRILVTGANGFIGKELCRQLLEKGYQVRAAVRKPEVFYDINGIQSIKINEIDAHTDWNNAVKDIDIIVHLAARVHVMTDDAPSQINTYRQVNVDGTRSLAETAARAGVNRFVFISSIKVNGEESNKAYKEESTPQPEDPYGISKMEAENELKAVCKATDMERVIIRPPLVYGAGVKANFKTLMNLVHRRIPLPLASVRNQRSFIYLGNLVDSIIICMTHHAAAGQTYLVSDDRDVSTPELIRLIASSLNIQSCLFPFPQFLLRSVGGILGKGDAMKRLLGSLCVDISKIKRELSWQPPFAMESGLIHTAKWYNQR